MLKLALAALLCAALPAQTTDLYHIVFLRPAPDRATLPPEEAQRIQAAHMAHIREGAQGSLVAAGPFGDRPNTISGIFVFKSSRDAARRFADTDPTVVARRNTVEVVSWRGPAGIGAEYARIHKERPDAPQDMGIHPFVMLYGAPADTLAYLRSTGKIAAAGVVEDGGDLRAIAIFQRIPDDEARRLIAEDSGVKAGRVRTEYHRWFSAAHVLPE